MTREIKFRAMIDHQKPNFVFPFEAKKKIKVPKEFRWVYFLGFPYDTEITWIWSIDWYGDCTRFNGCIKKETIGQCTGLKDKNGKEIYESDRVKTPAGIGVVKWDKCFRLFWNEHDSTTLHDCISEQIELVGNVYES